MIALHPCTAIVDYPILYKLFIQDVYVVFPFDGGLSPSHRGENTYRLHDYNVLQTSSIASKGLYTNTDTLANTSGPHQGQLWFNYASQLAF